MLNLKLKEYNFPHRHINLFIAANDDITYTNSTLNANNITLITKENATIRGGNVHAQNSLIADIGKNLTVELSRPHVRSDLLS